MEQRREDSTLLRDAIRQLPVLLGHDHLDPGAEHGDGAPSGTQRASMGGGVNPPGQAADHRHPLVGQGRGNALGIAFPAPGRLAGAHHRHRPPILGQDLPPTPEEEGWIVELQEAGGIPRLVKRDEADAPFRLVVHELHVQRPEALLVGRGDDAGDPFLDARFDESLRPGIEDGREVPEGLDQLTDPPGAQALKLEQGQELGFCTHAFSIRNLAISSRTLSPLAH